MAFKCIDCVKKPKGRRAQQLPRHLVFPSEADAIQWGGSSKNNGLRCAPCWESYQRTNILPEVCDDEERRKRTAQLDSNGKRKAGASQPRRKKRTRISQCKWCKSTTHKTRKSKACPYNLLNLKKKGTGDFFFEGWMSDECVGGIGGYFQPPPPLTSSTIITTGEAATPSTNNNAVPSTNNNAAPSTNNNAVPSTNNNAAPSTNNNAAPSTNNNNVPANIEALGLSFCQDAVPPPQPIRQRFNEGDNVLARWSRGKWYHAHVVQFRGGRYDVYFMDGQTKDGLTTNQVRPPNADLPTRKDMLNKVFFCDGDTDLAPGLWKVRKIQDISFVAIRMSGGGPCRKMCEEFDVGYVMRQVRTKEEQDREQGPQAGRQETLAPRKTRKLTK